MCELLTFGRVISTARSAAGTVVDLSSNGRNHVATPAVCTVGQAHDILAQLQTDQLAVACTLIEMWAVVFEWCGRGEAANCDDGAGWQCGGRRGDRDEDSARGWGWAWGRRDVCVDHCEQRCGHDGRGQSEGNHDGLCVQRCRCRCREDRWMDSGRRPRGVVDSLSEALWVW